MLSLAPKKGPSRDGKISNNSSKKGSRKSKAENPLTRFCSCKKSPILIVDDDVFNIMTLTMIIQEQLKITPDSANNGLEAFKAFKKKRGEYDKEQKKKGKKKKCSANCPK
mmetsp:Transcript_35307/g.54058  ORF Transcript_35307/g.54058 Transcript_35307/m.54058 type:complete len:110 (-) Transcript_35307:687-1016(-)